MSDSDFEMYLSLLGRMLRLKPDQRDAISEELRDHLESRMEELIAAGYTRDDAARMALEEFGDAASVANQFVSVQQQQRKRWMMRFATFSIAGSFLATMFVFSFWPEGGKVQVVQNTIAQSPAEDDPFSESSAAEDPFGQSSAADDPFGQGPVVIARNQAAAAKQAVAQQQRKLVSEEEQTRAAEQKLQRLIPIEFFETPLEEAMDFLSDQTEIPIYLKLTQLDSVGVTAQEVVPNLSFPSVRVSMALDLMLHQMELDYVVRDGILIVTSAEDVELTHEIRVYDCSDLLSSDQNSIQKRRARGGAGAGFRDEGEMAMGGGMVGPEMDEEMMGMAMGSMMGGGGGMGGPARKATRKDSDLVSLILATVNPDSWEETGGAGSISQFQGLIVINNNSKTHRQTEELLEKIRSSRVAR